ncbi:Tat-linked quality control protein TatD [Candidatus Norongarragalina meridionalis]|nr:Tat-linked quality control protein TatD [Candidatus Norongarragalina meridionalis]
MLVDCHAHLEHRDFERDLDAVIAHMRKTGVVCVNTGANLEANRKALAITAKYPDILKTALGLSPHDANRENLEENLAFIRKNAGKICAIGEIGLDFHYFKKEEEREKQRTAFIAQLDLAEEFDLPAVIHTREAEAEVIALLAERKQKNAVLHCFLQPQLLDAAMKAGCLVSLPTLKNKARVTIIERVQDGRVLCETDSPYLWRGERNEPANVAEVYGEMERIRGAAFAGKAAETARNLFGW